MSELTTNAGRRSTLARIGVTLLNLLTPGLGLVRVGRLRAGLLFALGSVAFIMTLALTAAVAPSPSPVGFLIVVIGAILCTAFLYLGSIILTWRGGGHVVRPIQWWRSWYSLLVLVVIVHFGAGLAVPLMHTHYKPFYLPSDAMVPTLDKGDRILADMDIAGDPRRGEIILLEAGDVIYIKRVVAIAGDRIAMRGGVPVLNGTLLPQRAVGRTEAGVVTAEQLPDEEGYHHVLDMGSSSLDDMAEVVVPAGHVFVLGDNRDRSADSRVTRANFGLEMVPVEDIRGRALFRTWDEGFRWLGTNIQ